MMLWHVMEVTFQKLPREIGEGLARKVCTVALEHTLPGVAHELCTAVNEAGAAYPDVLVTSLLRPLISRLMEELPDGGEVWGVGGRMSVSASDCQEKGKKHQPYKW